MFKTTVAMLCLAAGVANAQQVDAPVQVRLVPDGYAEREASISSRASAASVLQGVGVTALILGGIAGSVWVGLELSQFSRLLLTYGASTRSRADYTPVLGLGLAVASAGLISLITAGVMKGISSSQRAAIAEERAQDEARAQAEFWARMDAEAAEIEATPSVPPPPPEFDAAKKPLVRR